MNTEFEASLKSVRHLASLPIRRVVYDNNTDTGTIIQARNADNEGIQQVGERAIAIVGADRHR